MSEFTSEFKFLMEKMKVAHAGTVLIDLFTMSQRYLINVAHADPDDIGMELLCLEVVESQIALTLKIKTKLGMETSEMETVLKMTRDTILAKNLDGS